MRHRLTDHFAKWPFIVLTLIVVSPVGATEPAGQPPTSTTAPAEAPNTSPTTTTSNNDRIAGASDWGQQLGAYEPKALLLLQDANRLRGDVVRQSNAAVAAYKIGAVPNGDSALYQRIPDNHRQQAAHKLCNDHLAFRALLYDAATVAEGWLVSEVRAPCSELSETQRATIEVRYIEGLAVKHDQSIIHNIVDVEERYNLTTLQASTLALSLAQVGLCQEALDRWAMLALSAALPPAHYASASNCATHMGDQRLADEYALRWRTAMPPQVAPR